MHLLEKHQKLLRERTITKLIIMSLDGNMHASIHSK